MSPKELLTPMKPAKQIDGTIVSRKIELVKAWDTTGARTKVLVCKEGN